MLLIGRDFETPGHGWRIESLSAQIRVPRHWLEPVASSLTNAGLLTRTNDQRLIPARDPRRIEVADILSAVRRSERDSHGASDDWNDTVSALAESVERAICDALAGRSLADMVDADARAEAAAKAMDAPAAAPPKPPRVASNR
jgi:DNA-binding IscR family transcriptional regulator